MEHPVVAHLASNPVSSLEELGIFARWSDKNPRKVSLNYDQIEAKDGHPLVDGCRGLVVRQDHDGPRGSPGAYSVLARPFTRFYNLGSGHAADIDWSTAAFEEKLDGTLCIVYLDPDLDDFCVATRSVPDADVPNSEGVTFAELFWRHSGASDVGGYDAECTYLYELTGPGNQIGVPYDAWGTTLLARIDNATGVETPGDAPRHRFETLAEAQDWLGRQPGHAIEGFIVRDGAGRRVKVKSAQYLAIAKVMTAAGSDVSLTQIVLSGTADDVRGFLPKPRQERIDLVAGAVARWASGVEAFAAALPPSERKDAALAVKASPYAAWIGLILDLWLGKHRTVSAWIEAGKVEGEITRSVAERVWAAVKAEVDPA